jgi:hypothetical protein
MLKEEASKFYRSIYDDDGFKSSNGYVSKFVERNYKSNLHETVKILTIICKPP